MEELPSPGVPVQQRHSNIEYYHDPTNQSSTHHNAVQSNSNIYTFRYPDNGIDNSEPYCKESRLSSINPQNFDNSKSYHHKSMRQVDSVHVVISGSGNLGISGIASANHRGSAGNLDRFGLPANDQILNALRTTRLSSTGGLIN